MIEKEWRTRLRLMIDLVFASAMTVLILTFNVPPSVETETSTEFLKLLVKQGSSFTVFVISFLVIAVYWIKNLEYFRMLGNVDKTIIWLHLVYLILVMLLPLANLIFSLFPTGVGIRVLFSILMVFMGLISFAIMYYAHRKKFLDDRFDIKYVRMFTRQLLDEPIIAFIAGIMAFVQPFLWDASFLLIPLVMTLGKKAKIRQVSKEEQ